MARDPTISPLRHMQLHDPVDSQTQGLSTYLQGSRQNDIEKAETRETYLFESHNLFGISCAFLQKSSLLLSISH